MTPTSAKRSFPRERSGGDLGRREFLKLGAGFALATAAGTATSWTQEDVPPVPRINGGMNIQPLRRLDLQSGFTEPLIIPELVDIQMKRLYELGFEWMRITISFDGFGPEFFAAIPYVRAARALGIDVLGIIGQFAGRDLVRALSRPETRDEVLGAYLAVFNDYVPPASSTIERPGIFAVQVLNEPTNFVDIAPSTYVRQFLAPTYNYLKDQDPQLTVVSAASVGSAEGLLRTRSMLDVGMEQFCDGVAYHIYDRRFIPRLAGLTIRPVWVTESGTTPTARHLNWITETFPEIREGIEGVEQIFYFQLYDAEPHHFRLIDISAEPDGSFRELVESTDAVGHFASRVVEASGDQPRARYEDLIPDITRYFPTEEDLALLLTTSFGQETWRF